MQIHKKDDKGRVIGDRRRPNFQERLIPGRKPEEDLSPAFQAPTLVAVGEDVPILSLSEAFL